MAVPTFGIEALGPFHTRISTHSRCFATTLMDGRQVKVFDQLIPSGDSRRACKSYEGIEVTGANIKLYLYILTNNEATSTGPHTRWKEVVLWIEAGAEVWNWSHDRRRLGELIF